MPNVIEWTHFDPPWATQNLGLRHNDEDPSSVSPIRFSLCVRFHAMMSCFVCGFCIGWCVFAFACLLSKLSGNGFWCCTWFYVVLHGDAFSISTQVYALVSYIPKKNVY